MHAAVELLNVTKRYGPLTALREITLSVEQGEAVAFLGPNGAGKTTLLRIIAGQTTPTSGQIKVLDLDAGQELEAVKRNVGLVGHRSFLYDELTVEENLLFYGRFFDATRDDLERVLDLTNLRRWSGVRAKHLSFGLRKRADIARAMIGDPRVLVLDELFSGLDREACGTLLEHLKERTGRTILVSSHSLEWTGKLCGRGVFLQGGSIVRDVPL
ncbi:MAG: ABC transporter ATP-binding protein [Candidatus Bathyarchaeia archaeon]